MGIHASPDGTTRASGSPLPLVDLDLDFGANALHAESIPYVETRDYGAPSAPSSSRITAILASLRTFLPGRKLALGLGYGALYTRVDRTAPSGELTLEATGIRIEAFERIALTPRSRLELTIGGIPQASGSLVTRVGVPGAASPRDALVGSQIDATIRDVITSRGSLGFDYGVRYVVGRYTYASSHVQVERNAVLLPFAELRVRL